MDVQRGMTGEEISEAVCSWVSCPSCGQEGFVPFGLKIDCLCGSQPYHDGKVYMETKDGSIIATKVPDFVWEEDKGPN
jgi:hypothetical protein